jgi:type I restriction-modification system DNA methylase subunit
MHSLLKFALSTGLVLLLLPRPGYALDADQKAALDAYKRPWDIYLSAMQNLEDAIKNAKGDEDVVKAADKFCDDANRFVDEYNDVRERFQGSEVLKSMDNDAEAKKNIQDFMTDLRKKIEASKNTFDALKSDLLKYASSPEIKRVQNRLSSTMNRIQLVEM